MRSVFKEMGGKLDPKALFYQTQKFKVRAMRVVEAVERLIGARPGQKLEVNFRAVDAGGHDPAGRAAAGARPHGRRRGPGERPHRGLGQVAHVGAGRVRRGGRRC